VFIRGGSQEERRGNVVTDKSVVIVKTQTGIPPYQWKSFLWVEKIQIDVKNNIDTPGVLRILLMFLSALALPMPNPQGE